MSIKPETLDHPERDLEVITRGGPGPKLLRKPAKDSIPDELRIPRDRMEAARQLKPQGRDLHCYDCWNRGRDAALRIIEGGSG